MTLLVSLAGLGLLDFRHRLAFAAEPIRTGTTVAVAILFFLAWDVVGIYFGIFFRGDGPYLTGITLGRELPLEEVFFLAVLSYSTILSYLGAKKWLRS
jgi:lycopene cyclase domain-containing protein